LYIISCVGLNRYLEDCYNASNEFTEVIVLEVACVMEIYVNY